MAGDAASGVSPRQGLLPGLLARLRDAVPAGTMPTAAGVAVLGVASYVHLAIAGHSLPLAEKADLSVLWSVVFSVGYGFFLPVEQEATRVVAARRIHGLGSRPVWRRAIWLAAAIFAALALGSAVLAPALADQLFTGGAALVAVTLGGLLGVAVAAPVRGQTAGVARFDLYGALLGLDGAVRIVLAVGLALVGAHTAVSFGLILLVAPVLATAVLFVPARRTATDGPPTTYVELGRGVWPLIVSVLLSQVMLNSVVVAARLIAPEQALLVAALLAALVLIRIPTLAFGALQASLLSGLAAAGAAGDRGQFGRLLRQAVGLVTAMMAAFAVLMIAVGPWLVGLLFAAPDVLGRGDIALLTAGTWAYLLALVLGQAAMSLHRHGMQTLAWLAGTVVLVGVTLLPGPVLTRLDWAYAIGNATVVAVLGCYLALRGRLHWPRHG